MYSSFHYKLDSYLIWTWNCMSLPQNDEAFCIWCQTKTTAILIFKLNWSGAKTITRLIMNRFIFLMLLWWNDFMFCAMLSIEKKRRLKKIQMKLKIIAVVTNELFALVSIVSSNKLPYFSFAMLLINWNGVMWLVKYSYRITNRKWTVT